MPYRSAYTEWMYACRATVAIELSLQIQNQSCMDADSPLHLSIPIHAEDAQSGLEPVESASLQGPLLICK